jgi:hypothetical protein
MTLHQLASIQAAAESLAISVSRGSHVMTDSSEFQVRTGCPSCLPEQHAAIRACRLRIGLP